MLSHYYKKTHDQLSRAKQTGVKSFSNDKYRYFKTQSKRKCIKTKSFDSYRITRAITEAITNHRKKITVEMISKYFRKEKSTPISILYLFI